MQSRSREIGCYDDRIALKFDWPRYLLYFGTIGKFKHESRYSEILWSCTISCGKTSVRSVNRGPEHQTIAMYVDLWHFDRADKYQKSGKPFPFLCLWYTYLSSHVLHGWHGTCAILDILSAFLAKYHVCATHYAHMPRFCLCQVYFDSEMSQTRLQQLSSRPGQL